MLSCFVRQHNLRKKFFPTKLSQIILPNFSTNSSEVMKILNVAEKNDAAKNIALHLSRGSSRRREGLSQYNKIYEFECEVLGQRSQMVMTSVSGHLLALDFVGTYRNWQACNPLVLFEAPVYKYCPQNYENIKKTLEREVRQCTALIIWTDCDREGENIGCEIAEVCRAAKPDISIYRARFSDLTPTALRRALNTLQPTDEKVSAAVDVRQELDLRIGAAFTRFQTLRLQRVFPALRERLVSYGSCQFPTLGFVVERYRAVQQFVPEPFWKIVVKHTIGDLTVEFAWDRGRLYERDAAEVLHDACTENNIGNVTDVVKKPRTRRRPLPLDTVELEKVASRKLKINAKETMRIAEKLYTQGLISYPRTETNQYGTGMNLAQLVGMHTGDANWGPFAQSVLDSGGPNPRQGSKSDQAHPPIHPTKYTDGLTGNEKRIYELVVRSFLACVSKDAAGEETAVSIVIGEEKFKASGLVITDRGYLDVYPYDYWNGKQIHQYQPGQQFTPSSMELAESSTSPPALLTEADLIALMEKHGIGTDATHAEHIETIKSREYVSLCNAGRFLPGVLGAGLVDGYDSMGLRLARPQLRAQLEADLKAICEGRKQPHVVLAEQIAAYKAVFERAAAQANKLDAALATTLQETPLEYTPAAAPADANAVDFSPVMKCAKCGADMMVRRKRSNADEFYIGCASFPRCTHAMWLPSLVKSVKVMPRSCNQCGPNFKMLEMEWRNNSLSHLYPSPCVACLGGCDKTLLELLNIRTETRTNPPRNNIETRNEPFVNQAARPTTNLNQSRQTLNQPRPILNQPRPTFNQRAATINQPRPPINRASQFVPPPAAPRGNMPLPGAGGEDNNVVCGCNQPAVFLTVKKQNENFGKKFYKCALGKDRGGCDFFSWAPDSNTASTSNVTPRPASGDITRGWGITPAAGGDYFGAVDDGDVKCNCGMPCKKITVHKEGPNKGRLFYGCAKDNIGARCNFFQWADDAGGRDVMWGAGGGGSRGGNGGGSRGRGRGFRGRGAGVSGGSRKCSRCKQPGHTRARCPDANEF